MLLAVMTGAPNDGRAQSHATKFGVAEIQARLFYSNSGRLSANVIANSKITLWNVVAGEGAGLEGPSDRTLLTVRIAGPAKASAEGLQLHVVALADADTLLDDVTEMGDMNSAGNWYAGYWLYDTGCTPVKVLAELSVGQERQQLAAKIPFSCGE
jgi:hypothetical protein